MISVTEALHRRYSCRAFKSDPVPKAQVRAILERAVRAPSGGNLQPWRMIVVTGEERDRIVRLAAEALQKNPQGEEGDYPVYPAPVTEPYRTRRYEVGMQLYDSVGIAREDKLGRLAWMMKNFSFFDAPVGIFFITRRSFGHGQWAHMGMLMQSIALAAVEEGLATCMQEAWAMVRDTLHGHFALDEDELVYCGMALGYPDTDAPVNRWRSERAPIEDIVEFRGFEEEPLS